MPLVDKTIYVKCFNEWKASQTKMDSSPSTIENSWFDDDMEVPPTQQVTAVARSDSNADAIASIRCDDYEAQMSPLVYESSESDVDDNTGDDTIQGTQTESITSTEPKQNTSKTKETPQLDDDGVTKRILRSQDRKRSLRSSNSKYQSDPRLGQMLRAERKSKLGKKFKSRQNRANKTDKSDMSAYSCSSGSTTTTTTTTTTKSSTSSRIKSEMLTWSQETSGSDIQLVQEEHMTPITISSSSTSPAIAPPNVIFSAQRQQESPDIFDSSTEQEHDEAASAIVSNSSPSTSPIPAGQSRFAAVQTEFDGSDTICTQDIIADSQDIANTSNPVDALCTTTSDIFEITKNNIFHNVLRVNDAEDATPAKHSDNVTPIKSCFSGVRLVLPRLKSDEILELQREVSQRAQEQSDSTNEISDELIDLTAESQLNMAISIEDVGIDANVEKTPQRKRPLTPSTRSCVRQSNDIYISSDDEGPSKTPTRSGWIKKRTSTVTSPHATPRSRRRLDKWFPSRASHSSDASKSLHSVLQPRNIFGTMESKQMQRLRASGRSMPESPSLFSSDDE